MRIAPIVGMLRDGWLIVGLTFGLLLTLELLYRAQAYVRNFNRPSEITAPEEHGRWLSTYHAEMKAATENQQWYPYIYHRARQFAGQTVNVDSVGLRRTVHPYPVDSQDLPEVYMFGGSTMHGTFQRDEFTIASQLAKRLGQCGARVRVLNLGESGKVLTTEVVELLLRLRDGGNPRAVVFYDGINDVAAFVQHSRPGWPMNEGNRSRDFELGRAVFWWESDIGSETRAFAYLAYGALTRSRLLQRIQPFSVRGPLPQDPKWQSTDTRTLLTSYASTLRLVEGLSHEFGFRPVYVWQPTLHATNKQLSSREAEFLERIKSTESGRRMLRAHREAATVIDSQVRDVAGSRFVNLSRLFDSETRPIFADQVGHTYETANEAIVAAMMPALDNALSAGGAAGLCKEL